MPSRVADRAEAVRGKLAAVARVNKRDDCRESLRTLVMASRASRRVNDFIQTAVLGKVRDDVVEVWHIVRIVGIALIAADASCLFDSSQCQVQNRSPVYLADDLERVGEWRNPKIDEFRGTNDGVDSIPQPLLPGARGGRLCVVILRRSNRHCGIRLEDLLPVVAVIKR